MAFFRSQAQETFGDSDHRTVAVSGVTIHRSNRTSPRLVTYLVTDAGADVSIAMDDARQMLLGGPHLSLLNDAASLASLTLVDSSGNTLATVAAGEALRVYLIDNASSEGLWRTRLTTIGAARAVL